MKENRAMQEPKEEEIILWQDHVNDPGYRWKLTMIKWPDGTHSIRAYLGGEVYTRRFVYPERRVCDTNFKPLISPGPSASESINEAQCGKCGWKGDHLIKHICEPKSTEPSQEKVDEVTLLNRKIDYIAANAVRIDGVALDQTNEWTLSKWLNPEIANAKL